MAIVLTQYEKHSLLRFLGVYIVFLSLLVGIIGFLVFWILKDQLYENTRNTMLLESSRIAQTIISEHMNGKRILNSSLLTSGQTFDIALFDSRQKRLYGELPFMHNQNKFFIQKGQAFLLDDRTYGHLGVKWILIKTKIQERLDDLVFYTLLTMGLCFIFIVLLGLVLGKMFLKPIRDGISSLDCFIKDITHELNTPISALIMSTNSLKKGVNEQKLLRIDRACRRIEFLYNNLTFLFLGEIRSVKEEVEFLDLLKNRIEMFEHHLQEKNISLSFLSQEKCLFYADKESLIRLIDNLLSNAIKYNQENGKILLSLSRASFCIQNTGKAIPSNLREKIKTRYFQANVNSRGYGIGLDIIQKVALTYHWRLEISYQNRLNTFEILF